MRAPTLTARPVSSLLVEAVADGDAATLDAGLLADMGTRAWTPLRELFVVTVDGRLVDVSDETWRAGSASDG